MKSACAALAACAAVAACAPALPEPDGGRSPEETFEPAQVPVLAGQHAHLLPLQPAAGAAATAPARAAELRYYGGHVISNVRVYAVLWGTTVDSATRIR